jgi:hypothetical protein
MLKSNIFTKINSFLTENKMLPKILVILAFFYLIYNINAILPSDYCILIDKKCNQTYSSKPECQHNECNLYPYIHKCGPDKCAKNKTDCDDFITIRKYLRSFIFKSNIGMPIDVIGLEMMAKRINNFKKFETKIKECPKTLSNFKYVFQTKDICMRRKKCYKSSNRLNGVTHPQAYIKIDCPCDGRHIYECEKDFCTPNKLVCNAAKRARKLNRQQFDSIQRCRFLNF